MNRIAKLLFRSALCFFCVGALLYGYSVAWSVDRSESVAQARFSAQHPTEYYPPDYQP